MIPVGVTECHAKLHFFVIVDLLLKNNYKFTVTKLHFNWDSKMKILYKTSHLYG